MELKLLLRCTISNIWGRGGGNIVFSNSTPQPQNQTIGCKLSLKEVNIGYTLQMCFGRPVSALISYSRDLIVMGIWIAHFSYEISLVGLVPRFRSTCSRLLKKIKMSQNKLYFQMFLKMYSKGYIGQFKNVLLLWYYAVRQEVFTMSRMV